MTLETPLLSGIGMACVGLGAALLGGERERRLSAAGLVVLGLALAAWRAGSPPDAALTPPGRLGTGFLVVNGGFLLAGGVLVGATAVGATATPLRAAARLLVVVGLLLLGVHSLALVRTAGWPGIGAGLGLGLAGALTAAGLRTVASGRLVRRFSRALAPPPLAPAARAGVRAFWLVLAAGATAVGLGSHVAPVFAGLIAASWTGYLIFHPSRSRPIPVSPVLTLLLVPAYWMLAVVAGPFGLRVARLPQVPLSPAAELLVAAPLLLVAWAVAGLWPLQRQLPGALFAPLGALLLARAALPLTPDGLGYLRPLSVPLIVLGIWQAAAHARWPLALAGAGFLGVAGGMEAGLPAALALLAAGLALEIGSMSKAPVGVTALVRAAVWPAAAWSGPLVLEGGLRGEVVYTALGALGIALIVAAGRTDAATTAPDAR